MHQRSESARRKAEQARTAADVQERQTRKGVDTQHLPKGVFGGRNALFVESRKKACPIGAESKSSPLPNFLISGHAESAQPAPVTGELGTRPASRNFPTAS